jgi:hypothetical protein
MRRSRSLGNDAAALNVECAVWAAHRSGRMPMTAIVVACDGVRLLFAWMSSLLTNKKPKSEIPDVPLTVAYLRSLSPFAHPRAKRSR